MAARKKSKVNRSRVQLQKKPAENCCYKAYKILFLLMLAAVGIIWFFWHLPSQSPRPVEPMIKINKPLPSPSSRTSQIDTVNSADGTMTLKMKTEKQPQGSLLYTFFAITNSSGEEKQLFTKVVEAGSLITLPANSWSPDNKSAFIKETGPDKLTFLVFKASGDDFKNGEKYYDIGALFKVKQPKYNLKDATGWADDTLVIIKTNIADTDAKGPSFWFDLSSQAFLMLSR